MSTSKKSNARLAKAASLVPLGWPPANLLEQKNEFDRKVVFDLHGPIVDWTTRFYEFASELYERPIDISKMRIYCGAYAANIPITPVEFNKAFWAFARLSRGGYDALNAQPHAVDAIHAIQKAGIKVEIWTYVPGSTDYDSDTLISQGSGAPQDATYRLLEQIGVGSAREVRRMVRFIHPERKAPQMGEEHVPLIIEDHPGTAVVQAMCYGGATILVPETYNQHLTAPGILRLDKREDLADAVIGFFDALDGAGCLNISKTGEK